MIAIMAYIVYHNMHTLYLTLGGMFMNVALYLLIDIQRDMVRMVRGRKVQ